MEKKVTIGMIADLMGVSPITVSRALAAQPGVSAELRQKIVRKARELGYKKAKAADRLNLLLLVKKRFTPDNSNFSQMVQGLEQYIKQNGAGFSLEFVEKEKQQDLIVPFHLTHSNRYDGVVLLGSFEEAYTMFIRQIIDTMVVFNGYSDEVLCDGVFFDYNRTGFRSVQYLVEQGHRRFGFVGIEGRYNSCQRFWGFCRGLQHHSLDLQEKHVVRNVDGLATSVEEMIAANDLPSAFVCNSDHTALRLIRVLHEHNYRVPQDVSVLGSGNVDIAQLVIPAITTFDLNITFACQMAVQLLLERIAQPHNPYVTVYVDTLLVEGQSAAQVQKGEE